MRCVFSESVKDNALDLSTGAPPGGPPGRMHGGVMEWRATATVLRSTFGVFSSVLDDLVTTIFPADCRACGSSLLRAESSPLDLPVCDLCLSRLLPQTQSIPAALCKLCGEALGLESGRSTGSSPAEGLLCSPCRVAPPPFARAVAYGVYEDELRETVRLLKYDGVRGLAKPLGAKLADAVLLLENEAEWTGDLCVVGVPLFAANYRERGFNQSILLADEAILKLRALRPGWKLQSGHGLLRRVKATKSQFSLSTRGRVRNLAGAFKVPEDHDERGALVGRDVLLIDDIYTTGATSRACAGVLRRAGAKRVWVATLARAQREQVALWSSSGGDFG